MLPPCRVLLCGKAYFTLDTTSTMSPVFFNIIPTRFVVFNAACFALVVRLALHGLRHNSSKQIAKIPGQNKLSSCFALADHAYCKACLSFFVLVRGMMPSSCFGGFTSVCRKACPGY